MNAPFKVTPHIVAAPVDLDEFERRLAAWMEAERKLAQAHIDFARDLAADLKAIDRALKGMGQ